MQAVFDVVIPYIVLASKFGLFLWYVLDCYMPCYSRRKRSRLVR